MVQNRKASRVLTFATLFMCALIAVFALSASAQAATKAATDTATESQKEATTDKKASKSDTTAKESAAKDSTSKVTTDSKTGEKDSKAATKDTTSKADSKTEKDTKDPAKAEANGAWAEGLDCESCHEKVLKTIDDDKYLTAKHPTVECVTCHADESLGEIHEGVTEKDREPSSLRASEVDTALCETCHNPETLIEKTEDCTILTDENGTVVNPHDLPEVSDHAEVTCVSCHKMHSKTGIEKSAGRACSSCHHTNVYECGTCHAA